MAAAAAVEGVTRIASPLMMLRLRWRGIGGSGGPKDGIIRALRGGQKPAPKIATTRGSIISCSSGNGGPKSGNIIIGSSGQKLGTLAKWQEAAPPTAKVGRWVSHEEWVAAKARPQGPQAALGPKQPPHPPPPWRKPAAKYTAY